MLRRRRHLARVALLLTALATNLLTPSSRAADDNPNKLAITDPPQVDDDFAYQGEYITTCARRGERSYPIGVQVMAQGDGRFQATIWANGLPGSGWNHRNRFVLDGELNQERVAQMQNDRFRLALVPQGGVVVGADGGVLARLRRVERVSPTLGACPPYYATVLFAGRGLEALEGAKLTDDGWLAPGARTKDAVQDFQLHLEFRTPYMPKARGQGRGNSGVYIQQRYEVQILDSFGLEGHPNECGGIYRQMRPAVNMCLPPLTWQTYDIYFTAARWNSEGQKVSNARITVLLNGYPVQNDYELVAKTGAGKEEGPQPLPILFQHHGDPVAFRNVWLVHQNQPIRRCLANPPQNLVPFDVAAFPWSFDDRR